jgi:FAD/FMN-containing dehydrogenase
MRRRDLLKNALAVSLTPVISATQTLASVKPGRHAPKPPGKLHPRVRPADPGWPSQLQWERLRQKVGGRLLKLASPFDACRASVQAEPCAGALKHVRNPYYLGDEPALTQASGWVDAWTSVPSAYAVAAQSTADVMAAVKFARDYNLRLVVKGGGHSYQGTSCAPDSLLIWLRHLNSVQLHQAFKAQGCDTQAPQPAVTIGAGALWADAYEAVTTRAGRYVQGGGCRSVGVAGLVQSGGFGSFSKRYGTAAAALIEAEIVTADGRARLANECMHPDLFWALKGGGGGTFGVVTRLTLRTRELPDAFGAVLTRIKAASDQAYRELIAKAISFYRSDLFTPRWGEQMRFAPDNVLGISMLFEGLSRQQAQGVWAPFLAWVRAHPEYSFQQEPAVLAIPARRFWDPDYLLQHMPGSVIKDERKGAPPHHAFWAQNQNEAGQLLHGYQSAWLPASLIEPGKQPLLVEAVFASSRHWPWALHFNKGLAGAPEAEIAAASDTATNPAMLDAFALAIIASEGPPAFPGMPGAEPDLTAARDEAQRIGQAMAELLKVAPGAGAYVAESNYFQQDWQTAFWGANYRRLASIKEKHDPEGLFCVHHGVGSEAWSADGFTPAPR